VVICLERGADLHMAQLMSLPLTVSCFSRIHIGFTFLVLHMAQLMPLPLTVSCFSRIHIGFTFLVPARLTRVDLDKRPLNGMCVLLLSKN